MKIKTIAALSACTLAVILIASCGKNANMGRRIMNDNADVRDVLEQRISQENGAAQTGKITAAEAESPVDVQPVPDEAETQNSAGQPADEIVDPSGVDVDLTTFSATMVYAEVYNMMFEPENYVDKIIRMNGTYSVFLDESTGKTYHACIIKDATACCAQGIEFELTDENSYPETEQEVCVTGRFDLYHEGGYTYCILRDATLTK